MIVKFFSHGSSKSGRKTASSVKDYLLNKDRVRDNTAKIVRGDEQQTSRLIDLCNQAQFSSTYTAGCLSFDEQESLADDQKQALMQSFEQALLPDFDPTRYACYWVEHTDKDRLELNFVFAKIDLATGKHLGVYSHRRDMNRLNNWKEIKVQEYDLIDPNAPERERDFVALEHTIRRADGTSPEDNYRQVKQDIDEYLHSNIELGYINGSEDIKRYIEYIDGDLEQATGYQVKQNKTGVSVTDTTTQQKFRLQGKIYAKDFHIQTSDRKGKERISNDRKQRQARHDEQRDERLARAIECFAEQCQYRTAELVQRYGYGSADIHTGTRFERVARADGQHHRPNEREITGNAQSPTASLKSSITGATPHGQSHFSGNQQTVTAEYQSEHGIRNLSMEKEPERTAQKYQDTVIPVAGVNGDISHLYTPTTADSPEWGNVYSTDSKFYRDTNDANSDRGVHAVSYQNARGEFGFQRPVQLHSQILTQEQKVTADDEPTRPNPLQLFKKCRELIELTYAFVARRKQRRLNRERQIDRIREEIDNWFNLPRIYNENAERREQQIEQRERAIASREREVSGTLARIGEAVRSLKGNFGGGNQRISESHRKLQESDRQLQSSQQRLADSVTRIEQLRGLREQKRQEQALKRTALWLYEEHNQFVKRYGMSSIAVSDTDKANKLNAYASQFKKADWEALGEFMRATQDPELLQAQQELFTNAKTAGLWRSGHPFITPDISNRPQIQKAVAQFGQVQNTLLGNDWQKQMHPSNQQTPQPSPEQAYDDEMEQRRQSAPKPRF